MYKSIKIYTRCQVSIYRTTGPLVFWYRGSCYCLLVISQTGRLVLSSHQRSKLILGPLSRGDKSVRKRIPIPIKLSGGKSYTYKYTPVSLECIVLVAEVGYNTVVPWILNFFPLNAQFSHPLAYKISQNISFKLRFFFLFQVCDF